jgi:predicted  nucleic acid-binding Zn-ribbon protein
MTQATETDIRDIKTSIDNLTKATESLARSTEANSKAITDLTLEMRVGFANVTTQITRLDSKIDNIEIKLDSKIDNLETKIEAKIDKLDGKIDKLETKIDGRFDTINSRLTNIESNTKAMFDLTEKVGELKNWKQIAIVVFTASVSGAIAWYVRGGSGNP